MRRLLAFVLIWSLIFSCKKGENDPLSLQSRCKRISGIWVLSEGTGQTRYYNAASGDTTVFSIATTQNSLTTQVISNGASGFDTVAAPLTTLYYYELTFDRNGNFGSYELAGSDTIIRSGYWYFTGKSEAMNLEKKEAVELVFTDSNVGSTYAFGGSAMPSDVTFYIDRLAKRELTLISEKISYGTTGDFWVENSRQLFLKF